LGKRGKEEERHGRVKLSERRRRKEEEERIGTRA
jgi:hypothetical protein